MQAAKLFEQGHPPAAVVHQFQVSWQTATRWYHAWRRQGTLGCAVPGERGGAYGWMHGPAKA
jgi:transposase